MSGQLDLRQLRSFHAIVRTGSVTAAAREMGLTQPSVSRILAQLEEEIGFALFYRDRGRLILTGDGLRLFEEVDVALGNIERVSTVVRDIAEHRVGELKLVAPPSFAEGVMPGIVSAFLERYPNVRLTIDSRSIETSKAMIATRAVDAGFVKLPLDRPDLRYDKLVTSNSVCVMRADHRLANHSELNPGLLKDEPLVLLGLGRASRLQIEAAFDRKGLSPNVRIETHTIGSACALAARGLGITIVNELLARSYLRDGLVARPFSPHLVHEYAFVTSALAAPGRLAAEFMELARTFFRGRSNG